MNTPIQILRIPVPKERLRALSKDERVLLLLLGYVANQIAMFEKLLFFSANKNPTEDISQLGTHVQTQMLLRLMIGALHEGWRLVTSRFMEQPIGKQYIPLLDSEGQKAFAELKNIFGNPNVISKIRNDYSFHHPKSDDVESAFDAAFNDSGLDADWHYYFAHHGYNSLFLISDFVMMHGVLQQVGEADMAVAQEKIMKEVTSVASNLVEFTKAFLKAIWLNHFGNEILSDRVITIHDAPEYSDVSIPFFVVTPGDKVFSASLTL